MTAMMTRDEYRDAIGQLGLTQEEVGEILGAGKRTARRWASGETPVPGPVEMHIRLWRERPELLEVARRLAEAREAGR
jgi:transcriptional regulator with XRE-family HTH domain